MTSYRIVIAAVAVCLMPAVPGRAERALPGLRWMSEAEVRSALVKQKVAGTLPDGQPWTELMLDDGRTDYVEGGRPMQGRWWFDAAGQLCFRYSPGGGGCFRYLQLSANCYEHFFSASQSPIPMPGPGAGILSNGPLWRLDEPSTCDAKPSV